MPRGVKTRGGHNRRVESSRAIELKDIHSKIDGLPSGTHKGHAHNLHGSSATAAIAHAASYFEGALIEERREDFVIPRQSQTRKELLGILPVDMEFAPVKSRQLDKHAYDGKATTVESAIQSGMVEVTDQRLVWKSDTTLLRRGNPFKDAESGQRSGYKRDGSIGVGLNTRKTRDSIPNADPEMEVVIGPALDNEDMD
jgi:hypothetical protein